MRIEPRSHICTVCGHQQQISTNHEGGCYDTCGGCSWKSSGFGPGAHIGGGPIKRFFVCLSSPDAAQQQVIVAAKISAIRAAAGNDGHVCPTCGKSSASPYVRIVDGKIIEGCIDAAHWRYLSGGSDLAAWCLRPVAAAIRAQELAHLESL